MKIIAFGSAWLASVLLCGVALSAEHVPGTASSRPAVVKANATQPAPLNFLIYDVGPDARHANAARFRHSSASATEKMDPA